MLTAARDLLVAWGHVDIADGLWLTQGSYRPKSVFSGRTHCGCGVVDIGHGHRVTGVEWTDAEWWLIERALRAVGFAAWHRPAIPGLWPDHAHAVAGYCQDLDNSAAIQFAAYLIGLNGLDGASRARDDGPREFVGVTWESYQEAAAARPQPSTQEEDMQSLIKVQGRPEVYLTDGRTAYHIPDEAALADVVHLAAEGTFTIHPTAAGSEGAVQITAHSPGGGVTTVWVREVSRIELVGRIL